MTPTIKTKLFLDLDDTIADFSGSPKLSNWNQKDRPYPMYEANFFLGLAPLAGAVSAVKQLIDSNKFEVYIMSKPLADSACSYSEKAAWVSIFFPRLHDKLILIQDKLLVKDDNAILIDDSKEWAGFKGFIHFNPKKDPAIMWSQILDKLL